jgi:hypothetical protein
VSGWGILKLYSRKEIKNERTVIAATADQMGMTAASHLATKMILYFKPKYLIIGGISSWDKR